jgi:hypothetical protein
MGNLLLARPIEAVDISDGPDWEPEDVWDGESQAGLLTHWTTKEGERLAITEMDTEHLFNAMKMCFNHLAEAHGGQPVWFTKRYEGGAGALARYNPQLLASFVLVMMAELDTRTDLPKSYAGALAAMQVQVGYQPRLTDGGCPF